MRNLFLQKYRMRLTTDELFWVLLLISFAVLLTATGLLQHDLWHDEQHFAETMRAFGSRYLPSLELLRSYNEMSTPLPFLMFGLGGRLVDFDLATMRYGMVLLAAAMLFVLYRTLSILSDSPRWSLASALAFLMNPYVFGASICLYTDIPALLFGTMALFAYVTRRPFWFGVLVWCAMMSRQYYVFLPLGILTFELGAVLFDRRIRSEWIWSPLLGLFCMVPLFLWWNGLAPQTELKAVYLDPQPTFHAASAILYISLGCWYAIPFFLIVFRRCYASFSNILLAVVLSMLFFIFPIRATDEAVSGGVHTVGLLHRALVQVGGEITAQTVFYLGFVGALIPVVGGVRGLLKHRPISPLSAALVSVLGAFLLVMSFSYHVWEKYYLPALSVEFVLLGLLKKEFTTSPQPDPEVSATG